ncbi:MAG TPA: protein-L-isoaspartate O-methyltransferase, partial [Sphingomicrobium sp.]|nr:protein-L-isoaspartate O-methyltransferase [Sphingomicrobium sp.]
RRAMVDSQLRPEGVVDAAVVNAMASLPREDFVPDAARALAYGDRPVPLGNGRALAPPAAIGRLLSEIEPRPGERALVVGAGSGYGAAVLNSLGLDVTAIESDPNLASMARAAAPRIAVVEGKLAAGYPGAAPYDIILIDGAVEHIPDAITGQLAEGGRIGAALSDRGVTRLVVGQNIGGRVGLRTIADADVAPLPGFERPKAFTF